MEQEREFSGTGTEREGESRDSRGLVMMVGAGLGYLVGKTVLKKPVLGAVVGAALTFVMTSSDEE